MAFYARPCSNRGDNIQFRETWPQLLNIISPSIEWSCEHVLLIHVYINSVLDLICIDYRGSSSDGSMSLTLNIAISLSQKSVSIAIMLFSQKHPVISQNFCEYCHWVLPCQFPRNICEYCHVIFPETSVLCHPPPPLSWESMLMVRATW